MLNNLLDNDQKNQRYLFDKGYLITTKKIDNLLGYPFYNNWNHYLVGSFNFYVKNNIPIFISKNGKVTFFIIGVAFNPYKKIVNEDEILLNLSIDNFIENINELTGIFVCGYIVDDSIVFLSDCSGMETCYYGFVENHLFISSHTCLVDDIVHLTIDQSIVRLINYKYYKYLLGNYLPGDFTKFKELKRVIPNTIVSFKKNEFTIKRFYPKKEIKICTTLEEYYNVLNEAAKILKNTMEIIPLKWEKPFISLTGGIDSNTTFAAAIGNYDKYETFSYISMYRESVDANAAKLISDEFNVRHRIINVPNLNNEVEDFATLKRILEYNSGEIGTYRDSDIRKKITLMNTNFCDVEVKSWISETVRAYAYKYFGRRKFWKKIRPREFSTLYKIFLFNRKLLLETDIKFAEYIKKTQLKEKLFNYDKTDFFVWEMMHGGKCGIDITNMKMCFDIIIPYNNRNLIDTLLRVPLKKRIDDTLHLDLKRILNKHLSDMNIRVVNLNETKKRKLLLNLIFCLNNILPPYSKNKAL